MLRSLSIGLLQKVTGRGGMVDFMMLETAKCPNCK